MSVLPYYLHLVKILIELTVGKTDQLNNLPNYLVNQLRQSITTIRYNNHIHIYIMTGLQLPQVQPVVYLQTYLQTYPQVYLQAAQLIQGHL